MKKADGTAEQLSFLFRQRRVRKKSNKGAVNSKNKKSDPIIWWCAETGCEAVGYEIHFKSKEGGHVCPKCQSDQVFRDLPVQCQKCNVEPPEEEKVKIGDDCFEFSFERGRSTPCGGKYGPKQPRKITWSPKD